MSPAMARFLGKLRDIKPGKRSFHAVPDLFLHAIMGSKAVEMGFAREVKHRDHTRSYVLTEEGRKALADDRDGVASAIPRVEIVHVGGYDPNDPSTHRDPTLDGRMS